MHNRKLEELIFHLGTNPGVANPGSVTSGTLGVRTSLIFKVVERSGFEPLTPCMPCKCSTN